MDSYSVATSWALFGAAVVGGCYYYWPTDQRRPNRYREDAQHAGRRRRNDQDERGRLQRRSTPDHSNDGSLTASTAAEPSSQKGNEITRKRKVVTKEAPQAQATPSVVVQPDEPEEIDMNTKQWAQQMVQGEEGT